ncbi:MAG: Small-conductance mechanosensitive channel MscMJ [Candidatus Methanofastidiosum methylothiophilum]|uniref:Small-conductance mechanosensitive channel MscMJ n=1 Tax=Candidatus Methanofastidiosum methylothiophilum TaxID=1705564 RepID=A0A150JA17_9EURY|nr:MAG: Small-conductance mechanosensitive channel MscMJ [Candidatus Methanofastidiosum methylthiophilus]NMC76770.1 mechanosensitive ion channel [Candidatus Methanofastidiosa archaeon]
MALDLIFLEIRLFFDTLISSVSEILPRLLFSIFILIAGFFIGKGLGIATNSLMKKIGVEKAINKTEAEKISERIGFKILKVIERFISWVVYIIAIFLAFEVLDIPVLKGSMGMFIGYFPNIIASFFVVILGLVVADKIALFVEKVFEDTNIPKYWFFGKGIRYFVYILVGTMALTQLKISTGIIVITITIILVLWSTITVIGLKSIIPNFFSGIFIVFYRQINVGDKIEIEQMKGIVEEVSLVYTKIKREDGKYLLIPNSKILDNVITKE